MKVKSENVEEKYLAQYRKTYIPFIFPYSLQGLKFFLSSENFISKKHFEIFQKQNFPKKILKIEHFRKNRKI